MTENRLQNSHNKSLSLMKTTYLFSLIICSFFIFSCSGSDEETPEPEKTVNDIQLTLQQRNMPLSSFDIGNYPVLSILVGNSIYFASYSNTAKPQFFTRFNLSNNTFSNALPNSNNVCGCGYSSKLVTDGTNIFYIANDATKFTASSNTWTMINYPASAKDNNGEAGVGYLNGNIYFIGGRTESSLFKYFNISQNQWFTAPNYLYSTSTSNVVAYKDRLYVLGGRNIDRKMSYYSTTTNNWTALDDLEFDINSYYSFHTVAVLGDNLYILQSDNVYIFDLVKNQWATNPITLTGLPSYSNLFSDGQKLYITGKNVSNIPVVFDLLVSME